MRGRPETKEEEARRCLAAGSWLIDPRYQFPREKFEAALRDKCRLCWHLREHFPAWVTEYVQKWSKEKQDGRPD